MTKPHIVICRIHDTGGLEFGDMRRTTAGHAGQTTVARGVVLYWDLGNPRWFTRKNLRSIQRWLLETWFTPNKKAPIHSHRILTVLLEKWWHDVTWIPSTKKPSHVSIFLPAPWIRHGIGLNREKTGRSNPWTNNPTPPDAAPWADALAASPAAVCRKCCATSHLSSSVEAGYPRCTGCFMTREELPPLNNPSTMTSVLMAACLEVGLPAKTKHVCFFCQVK